MEGPVVLQSKYGWSRMDHIIWILNMSIRLLNFFVTSKKLFKATRSKKFS